MAIAFYVSNQATRLKKTIELIIDDNNELIGMIAFVFIDNSNNDELRKVCKRAKLELIEENLNSVSKPQRGVHVSDKLLHYLSVYNVDYLLCFGEKVLTGELLVKYCNKIINFHPSVLPAFKGLHALDNALGAEAFLLGNSAHFIDEGIDTGPVIMQSLLHRSEYRTYDDVLDLQIAMLLQLMTWIKEGRLTSQNGRPHVTGASYSIARFIPNLEIDLNF